MHEATSGGKRKDDPALLAFGIGRAEAMAYRDARGQAITAREVAATIEAIPWEIVCRLGSRIERRYS